MTRLDKKPASVARLSIALGLGLGLVVAALALLGARAGHVQAAPPERPDEAPLAQQPVSMDVIKTVSSDPVAAGHVVTYTLTVTNTGSGRLHAYITDTLPAHVQPGGVVTYYRDIDNNQHRHIEITGTVQWGYSGTLTNELVVTTDEGISATYVLTSRAVRIPSITATKTVTPALATAGDRVTYTLRVTNTGGVTLTGISVSDYVEPSDHVSPGWSGWNAPDLGQDGVWSDTLTVWVDPRYSGTLTNTLYVDYTNEGVTAAYTITSRAVTPFVTATKWVKPAVAAAGERVTYTLRITNSGEVPLTDITVNDKVGPANRVSPNQYITSVTQLDPGAHWSDTFPISVAWGYSGTLTNTLSVDSYQGATAAFTVTSQAVTTPSVAATKWVTPAVVAAGGWVTYTLRVTNTGNVTLTDIYLDDRVAPIDQVNPNYDSWYEPNLGRDGVWSQTFPVWVGWGYSGTLTNTLEVYYTNEGVTAAYTITSRAVTPVFTTTKSVTPAVAAAGDWVTYTLRVTNSGEVPVTNLNITDYVAPADRVSPNQYVTSVTQLGSGASWSDTFPVRVDWGYSGTLTNVISANSDGGGTATFTHTSLAVTTPRVAATKSVTPTVVKAGYWVTYTLRVTNTGNVTLTDIAVADQVEPANLASPSQYSTNPPDLGRDGFWSQDLPVRVDWGYSGTLTNTLDVAAGEGVTASYTITSYAWAIPEVEASKEVNTPEALAGDPIVYTLRVTNTGNVTLTTAITDILPHRVTWEGDTTWQRALGPGEVFVQSLSPVVTEWGYSQTLVNVLRVDTGQGVSDRYTVTSRAVTVPAVDMSKEADRDPVEAGQPIGFNLRVENTGNVTLTATITDILPEHVEPGGVRTWSETLGRDGLWTNSDVYTVEWGYAGPLANTLQVDTEEGASGTSTVTPQSHVTPRMEVNKTPERPWVRTPREPITFTVWITNTGNVTLTNVVTDSLTDAGHNPIYGRGWTLVPMGRDGVWSETFAFSGANLSSGWLTNTVQASAFEGTDGAASCMVYANSPPTATVISPVFTDTNPIQQVPKTIYPGDGRGSYDPDNNLPLSYLWTPDPGVTIARFNSMSDTASFLAPEDPMVLHIYLIVTDSLGLQSDTPATVTIYIGVKAIGGLAAYNDSPTSVGRTTHFSATAASGSKMTYRWNYGDGSAVVTTTNATIDHVYRRLGTYTAVVTATNELPPVGIATTTVRIINHPPYTPSRPSPSDVSANVETDVTLRWRGGDPDGQVVTYTLAFGDGDPPPVVAAKVLTTHYAIGQLAVETIYYWRITATDGMSAVASPLWSFTTRLKPPSIYLPLVVKEEP